MTTKQLGAVLAIALGLGTAGCDGEKSPTRPRASAEPTSLDTRERELVLNSGRVQPPEDFFWRQLAIVGWLQIHSPAAARQALDSWAGIRCEADGCHVFQK